MSKMRKALARLLKPLNFSKIKGLTVALFFFVLSSSEKMSLAGTWLLCLFGDSIDCLFPLYLLFYNVLFIVESIIDPRVIRFS